MPSAGEISAQVARESERRSRLAVPAVAGGVIYLLGTIIIATTLNGAPTVGLLQGLAPALSGVANPSVSPRTAEVKYISHHAFPLIAGSVLAALALAVLTLALLLLLDAARFRRPEIWPAARPLVLFGGVGLVLVSIAHQIVTAARTHSFAVGSDFSNHAVDQALTKGAANMTIDYLDLLVGLALAAGMIVVMVNTLRVGLLPRWAGVIGMITAVLIFLPLGGAELEIIPAFWIVMMGILFAGRWPGGDPPAWAAGEARPWPTAAERRAGRPQAGAADAPQKGSAAHAAAGEQPPAPAAPATPRKRRRKRGARG